MERIQVAVGVIYNDARDAVLISRRGAHQHLAGYWEFPGGKLHDNETTLQALQRELDEELGIEVQDATPLMQVHYAYPDKHVLLDIHSVLQWRGDPQGREQQEIKWSALRNLRQIRFPEANRRIVTRLLLPEVYIISRPVDIDLDVVEQLLDAGLPVTMLQLRLENNNQDYLADIVDRLQGFNNSQQLQLIMNGVPEDMERYHINGVHLKAHRLFDYAERPVGHDVILGASCHDETELEQAQRLDADYVFMSPVKTTRTHPGATPLGWQTFADLTAQCSKPVYALGGMQVEDLAVARQYGAKGIAMIEAFWNSKDPGTMFGSLG